MPWQCTYDDDLNAFLVTGSGVVTEEELVSGLAARADKLRRHPDARVFHDYLGLTELKVPSKTIFQLAENDPGRRFPLRRAVLVSSPKIAGTMRFILGQEMEGVMSIFYERTPALQWLNEGMAPGKRII